MYGYRQYPKRSAEWWREHGPRIAERRRRLAELEQRQYEEYKKNKPEVWMWYWKNVSEYWRYDRKYHPWKYRYAVEEPCRTPFLSKDNMLYRLAPPSEKLMLRERVLNAIMAVNLPTLLALYLLELKNPARIGFTSVEIICAMNEYRISLRPETDAQIYAGLYHNFRDYREFMEENIKNLDDGCKMFQTSEVNGVRYYKLAFEDNPRGEKYLTGELFGTGKRSGKARHRVLMMKALNYFFLKYNIVIRPVKDDSSDPRKFGHVPDAILMPETSIDLACPVNAVTYGRDANIEAEVSTLDSPEQILNSLGYAVEENKMCIFCVSNIRDARRLYKILRRGKCRDGLPYRYKKAGSQKVFEKKPQRSDWRILVLEGDKFILENWSSEPKKAYEYVRLEPETIINLSVGVNNKPFDIRTEIGDTDIVLSKRESTRWRVEDFLKSIRPAHRSAKAIAVVLRLKTQREIFTLRKTLSRANLQRKNRKPGDVVSPICGNRWSGYWYEEDPSVVPTTKIPKIPHIRGVENMDVKELFDYFHPRNPREIGRLRKQNKISWDQYHGLRSYSEKYLPGWKKKWDIWQREKEKWQIRMTNRSFDEGRVRY